MSDFALIMLFVVIVLLSLVSYKAVVEYLDTMEQSLCAPKMILPNGTKLCK